MLYKIQPYFITDRSKLEALVWRHPVVGRCPSTGVVRSTQVLEQLGENPADMGTHTKRMRLTKADLQPICPGGRISW